MADQVWFKCDWSSSLMSKHGPDKLPVRHCTSSTKIPECIQYTPLGDSNIIPLSAHRIDSDAVWCAAIAGTEDSVYSPVIHGFDDVRNIRLRGVSVTEKVSEGFHGPRPLETPGYFSNCVESIHLGRLFYQSLNRTPIWMRTGSITSRRCAVRVVDSRSLDARYVVWEV